MTNKEENTFLKFGGIIFLILGICWVVNFAKLLDCDFETPIKCEAIHGVGLLPLLSVGLLPLLSLVTVWYCLLRK